MSCTKPRAQEKACHDFLTTSLAFLQAFLQNILVATSRDTNESCHNRFLKQLSPMAHGSLPWWGSLMPGGRHWCTCVHMETFLLQPPAGNHLRKTNRWTAGKQSSGERLQRAGKQAGEAADAQPPMLRSRSPGTGLGGESAL